MEGESFAGGEHGAQGRAGNDLQGGEHTASHVPGDSDRGRVGGNMVGFSKIWLDLKGAQSGLRGAYFHRKIARQFALAALQARADVRPEALAERRLRDRAALPDLRDAGVDRKRD